MFADRVQRLLESEARQVFAAALAPAPGPKGILIDDTLYDARLSVARPLDLFTDATFLREHGVRSIAPLSAHASRSMTDLLSYPALVIIIRGINAAATRQAVTAIRLARKQSSAKSSDSTSPNDDTIKTSSPSELPATRATKCIVLTTPRRSLIVEKILHTAGLSDVLISPLPLGFLPFDADLVTLDWPDAYRQVVLDGDNSAILASTSALFSLAHALNLEYATIRTAGAAATAVAEELLHTHGQTYPQRSPIPSQSSSPPSSVSSVARTSDIDFIVRSDAFAGGEDETEKMSELTLANVAGKGRNSHPVKLIIIDRGVDLVSPMLTQWTYEGLLDEAVGLHNNVLDLPVSSIVSEDAMGILDAGPSASGAVRKRLRGDVDKIFAQLRDLNYWTAVRQIGSVASSVREYYDRRPTRETSEISQVKDYVKGLREVKGEHLSAAAHTAIASEISARTFDSYDFKRKFELEREMIEGSTATGRRIFITDCIAKGESLSQVVRLCCLWSVTSGGIEGEELDMVKREMLANFGLGVLPLLANLERAGMLIRCNRESSGTNLGWIPLPRLGQQNDSNASDRKANQTRKSSDEAMRNRTRAADYSWQFARAAMRLMTDFDAEEEVKVGTTAAVAAPYSGYTPLTVRLIETGLSAGGWGNLPPVVAHTSLLPPGHVTVEHRRGQHETDDGEQNDDTIDAVILFVGGIVRAEASAVRMATRALGCRAVIATTAVVGPDEYVLRLSDRDSFGDT